MSEMRRIDPQGGGAELVTFREKCYVASHFLFLYKSTSNAETNTWSSFVSSAETQASSSFLEERDLACDPGILVGGDSRMLLRSQSTTSNVRRVLDSSCCAALVHLVKISGFSRSPLPIQDVLYRFQKHSTAAPFYDGAITPVKFVQQDRCRSRSDATPNKKT